MKKTLKILAITSMLAIVSQSVAFAATQNVNTTATVAAGALGITAGGTSNFYTGALSSSICGGSSSPAVSLTTTTLCSNITAVVVTDLRSVPAGWTVTTQLKHLTYKNDTIWHMDASNSGAVAQISGASPFDVVSGTYTGNHDHVRNVRGGYTFEIHTEGVRTGESGTTGKYIMYRPDNTTSGMSGTDIPVGGNVVDAGITFNFANVLHADNDMYFADVDAFHMFDRAAGSGLPGIATNTKFQPGNITAGSTSVLTGVTAANPDNDVVEHGSSAIISEVLSIMTAVIGAGKGEFTIAIGLESGLDPNSTASANFTAAIVITVV